MNYWGCGHRKTRRGRCCKNGPQPERLLSICSLFEDREQVFYLRFLLLYAWERAPPRIVALSAFQPSHGLDHASVRPLRVFECRKFRRGRFHSMFHARCAVVSRRLHMSFPADLHRALAPDALLSPGQNGIGFGLLHRHLLHHRCWILPQHGRRFLPVHGRLHHRFRHPRRRGRGTEEVEEGEEGFEHDRSVSRSRRSRKEDLEPVDFRPDIFLEGLFRKLFSSVLACIRLIPLAIESREDLL